MLAFTRKEARGKDNRGGESAKGNLIFVFLFFTLNVFFEITCLPQSRGEYNECINELFKRFPCWMIFLKKKKIVNFDVFKRRLSSPLAKLRFSVLTYVHT